MNKRKKNWGGVRPGSGRPKTNKKTVCLRLEPKTVNDIASLSRLGGITKGGVVDDAVAVKKSHLREDGIIV